ncbi:MAG: metallophosphatase [Crocinitomicaceae bacterium]|nr:metallophosphatase [Crocinitomicaceae bacterium]
MDRRSFTKNIGLGAIGLTTLNSFAFKKSYKRITILHTNDTHSRIDPFPSNHKKYADMGGVARRASLIHQIREEEKNVLLLDAGDIFQGTPYFNFFGGELELKLMTQLGYDAATMGNHDFDNSIEGFAKVQDKAKFPFLCANYDFTNTVLEGKTQPNTIFIKDGIRIGVFGVGVELKGLVSDHLYKETKYIDPISVAQDQVKYLREEKQCDLVICLSHLGYSYSTDKVSDEVLAQKTKGIDLIIGGHTHTFMEKPQVLKNLEEKNVLVNQVGFAGINLGRVDFLFDSQEISGVQNQSYPVQNWG